jgi:hypothetical protein
MLRDIVYATYKYIKDVHTFQINVLIRFLTSSACIEPHGFTIRKTVCTRSFLWYVFHAEIKIKGFYKVSNYKMLRFNISIGT